MTRSDPTGRFSDRVESYVRWRPGYPDALIDLLRAECGLGPGAAVADVGSGTGILTRRLLDEGARVFAVEPNAPMRKAAESLLRENPGFVSLDTRAEATTLPRHSINLVTTAQAFHWFDRPAARAEFARILVPGGMAALIWNRRLTGATPFLSAYENLLVRRGVDYTQVNHAEIPRAEIEAFFAPGPCRFSEFPYAQQFDREGLRGRALSSSYVPNAGEPGHEDFICGLDAIFDRHHSAGHVEFLYRTEIFYGPLS